MPPPPTCPPRLSPTPILPGEELRAALQQGGEELSAYILMQRILPPVNRWGCVSRPRAEARAQGQGQGAGRDLLARL